MFGDYVEYTMGLLDSWRLQLNISEPQRYKNEMIIMTWYRTSHQEILIQIVDILQAFLRDSDQGEI